MSGALAALFPLFVGTGAGAGGSTLDLALTALDAGGVAGAFGTGSNLGSTLDGLFASENSQPESFVEVAGSDSPDAGELSAIFFGAGSDLGSMTVSAERAPMLEARTCPEY